MKREKRSKPSRAAYLLLRAAMLQSQRQLLHARESNDFIEAKSLLKPGRPTKPSCECRLSDGAMVMKKCVTVIEQLRCKQTAGTRGAAGNNKGTVTNPHFKKGSMGTNALDDANGWAVL